MIGLFSRSLTMLTCIQPAETEVSTPPVEMPRKQCRRRWEEGRDWQLCLCEWGCTTGTPRPLFFLRLFPVINMWPEGSLGVAVPAFLVLIATSGVTPATHRSCSALFPPRGWASSFGLYSFLMFNTHPLEESQCGIPALLPNSSLCIMQKVDVEFLDLMDLFVVLKREFR